MAVSEINIGLDSQCFTYLFYNVLENCEEPEVSEKKKEKQKDEEIALVRIFLYSKSNLWLSPTVIDEYKKISDNTKLDIHNSRSSVHLCELIPKPSESEVDQLKDCLLKKHNEENDCKIISEYKLYGVDTVLSYDSDLLKRIGSLDQLSPLKIMSPSEFWKSLKIKKGSNPSKTPTKDNPLNNQT